MAARIAYYGNIVKDGLVLNLDAGKVDSYPKSGTTWSDISGFQNNATLTNGPTYDTGSFGSIVFDGTNDYGKTNATLNLSNTDKITIDVWMKFSITSTKVLLEHSTNFNSNNAFIISVNDFSGGGNGIGNFWFGDCNAGAYNISFTSAIYNDNRWHNFIVTSDRSLSATEQTKIYADSVLDTILSAVYRADLTSNYSNFDLYLGSRAGNSFHYEGNVGMLKIYNRILTSTEILQNYNATKGRFGL